MGGVTIYDLARAAGLSPSTVSRALRGHASVSPITAKRVQGIATSLGYRPNAVARSLAIHSSNLIAVMLPDIANPFFPSLVREVQLRAQAAGYLIFLCNTGGDPEVERQTLEMLASHQIGGIIVIGLQGTGYDLAGFLRTPIKMVSLDRSSAGVPWAVVQADHRGGAELATRYLLDLGHREIALIAGPPGVLVADDRTQGYRDALSSVGYTPDPRLIESGDFSEESGYRAATALLTTGRKFTALFAANDLMALGAMAAIRAQGWHIPQDVSVVGFDNIDLGRFSSPALTTVRQPLADLAQTAVDQLLAAIRQESTTSLTTLLPVSLVIRESSAPPGEPERVLASPLDRGAMEATDYGHSNGARSVPLSNRQARLATGHTEGGSE